MINFKIISPSFDIAFGLNDEDVEKLLEKVIKFSEPKENEKTIFVWPEGVILDSNLLKKSKFKELIKS